MYKGYFITIEGIDGIGKSSQIQLLLKALEKRNSIFFTKEPGDSQFGSIVGPGIREILFKSPGTKALAPGVGDLLFLADHVQNVHQIRAALDRGDIVVADRHADSQFAYSASPTKKAPAWANRLFAEHYGVKPDLTLLMRARGPVVEVPFGPPTRGSQLLEDIGWALKRANARRGAEAGKQDGKAWNDVEEQRTIQDAYLNVLQSQSRLRIIDVYETSTPEQVHEQILAAVRDGMESHTNGKQFVLPLVPTIAEAA